MPLRVLSSDRSDSLLGRICVQLLFRDELGNESTTAGSARLAQADRAFSRVRYSVFLDEKIS